jgi:hypothetical protein
MKMTLTIESLNPKEIHDITKAILSSREAASVAQPPQAVSAPATGSADTPNPDAGQLGHSADESVPPPKCLCGETAVKINGEWKCPKAPNQPFKAAKTPPAVAG